MHHLAPWIVQTSHALQGTFAIAKLHRHRGSLYSSYKKPALYVFPPKSSNHPDERIDGSLVPHHHPTSHTRDESRHMFTPRLLLTRSQVTRTYSRQTSLLRAPVSGLNFARTMASAPTLQEWLVIVPDHVGALEKRIAARPKHLEGLGKDREDMWLWGGT